MATSMITRDPFRIDGPAIISFSGGRTSAYMLWRILQAHGGRLPDDVKVCFANTGKEMPETLDFVADCAAEWSVPVYWLEYRWEPGRNFYVEVNYATASREGEPFSLMIRAKKMLPNPIARFCTQELKIGVIRKFAEDSGFTEWSSVIGLRADEPSRVSRLRANNDNALMPLAQAGVTKADVGFFWRQQDWDLRLPSVNGTTPLGNCDLCFLKSTSLLSGIMRERPELAEWWINAETAHASRQMRDPRMARFNAGKPSYAAMLDAVERQQNMDFGDLDQRIDCFCSEDAA